MSTKNKCILGGVLLIGVLCAGLCAALWSGEAKLRQPASYGTPPEAEFPEAYRAVVWKGESYTYKENLINILCLGIDGREKAEENTIYGAGPRADAIYLATLDLEAKKVTLLSISRDSMTDILIIDSFGNEAGLFTSHLCLQYTFGDGLDSSCQLTSEAVSRLLGGIPIHAYCALYWSAIKPVTDTVGPIGVYVPEYMTWVNPPVFHESGWVELDGRQAVEYVRERDIQEQGSNEVRSTYQQEFLQALVNTTKQKIRKNPLLVWELMKVTEDYLVTDLELDEILALSRWIALWNVDDLKIDSLPGECVEGDMYDEFYVDEKAKNQLILDLFYEKN